MSSSLASIFADDRTLLFEEGKTVSKSTGIYIDIFPLEALSGNVVQFDTLLNYRKKMMRIISLKSLPVDFAKRSWFKNLIVAFIKLIYSTKHYSIILKDIDNKLKESNTSDDIVYYANIAWGAGRKELVPARCFSDVIYVDFEKGKFPLAIEYDTYLRCIYNDYMQLPPEEMRVSGHHFKMFWK